jgi:integrase/recombinase XerD
MRSRFATGDLTVKQLSLAQACEGLIHAKSAAGHSPNTIRNYRVSFDKLQLYLGDPPFAGITRQQITSFMAWLRGEYVSEPDGVAPRGQIKLSEKSRLNIRTDLSALWTWAVNEGIVETNIVRTVEAPHPNAPVIEPLSQEEVEQLLNACVQKRSWKTAQRTATANELSRPTADRDRALIMLLLDTGMRASELCGMRMADLNMAANRIKVLGKGNKERSVYFGKRTAKALWKYVGPRAACEWVFTVGPEDDERPFTRDVLGRLLARIGERAGVPDVHPHRFRHTFAITFLRNGGDLLTLQALLGHSDLKMVQRYAHIVAADCQRAHQRSSPVDNWKL